MLNLKPYSEEIAEIEPGQTIRINHTDCEAGEDTRRRMYLTRTHADEAKVIGYCHNCQQGGHWKDGDYRAYRNSKHKAWSGHVEQVQETISEPEGLMAELLNWPSAHQAWAYKAGLTQDELNWYGIKYDPNTDRIYLPRWRALDRGTDIDRDLVGYQLRSVTHGPKYITVQQKDAINYTRIGPYQEEMTWAVIVEDLISAIHIIRATELADDMNLPGIYVNYGTKVDPTMMHTIANSFYWATVWLDNDNQHVVNQAKLMERTIKLYNNKIKVARVEEHSDPKHYVPNEINRILDEVWNGQY